MGLVIFGGLAVIILWSIQQNHPRNVAKWQDRKAALAPLGRYIKADIKAVGHRLRFILRRRQINDAMRTLDEELGEL